MSVTRAEVEAELIDGRGLGPWLASVGLDGTTRDGSNKALNGPIRRALVRSGYDVAGWLSVAEADVSAVVAADLEEFLDRAHLFTLKEVRDSWRNGDDRPSPAPTGATPGTPTARDLDYRRLLGIIEDMQERLDRLYGDDLGTISAGTIVLGFIEDCTGPEF